MTETENTNAEPTEHDPYYPPIITLPKQEIPTLEEDEEVIFKNRARLFRYDHEEDPPEWKERGVGEIKLLKHNQHHRVRVLMRRDKTFKLCANHYIQKYMNLKAQGNADKAWIWRVLNEFADGEEKDETLAIRFRNSDIAGEFKEKFEEAQTLMQDFHATENGKENNETEEKSDEVKQNGEPVLNNQEKKIESELNDTKQDSADSTTNKNDIIEATKEMSELNVIDKNDETSNPESTENPTKEWGADKADNDQTSSNLENA